jgi:ribosome recycling factor
MFDFTDLTQKLDKAVAHIKKELATLRTGKATPQILDPVLVDAYGAKMKITELANVSAPDANMLIIAPWDKSLLATLEKAIATAPLNINPIVDGDIIRIVIPPLTEERRKEMVKILHQKIEGGKIMLRGIRADSKKEIEKQKGQDNISEDNISADIEELDKTLKDYINQLEEIAKDKEKDLMTV